jgi:hypothetical protein
MAVSIIIIVVAAQQRAFNGFSQKQHKMEMISVAGVR